MSWACLEQTVSSPPPLLCLSLRLCSSAALCPRPSLWLSPGVVEIATCMGLQTTRKHLKRIILLLFAAFVVLQSLQSASDFW